MAQGDSADGEAGRLTLGEGSLAQPGPDGSYLCLLFAAHVTTQAESSSSSAARVLSAVEKALLCVHKFLSESHGDIW